MKVAIVEDNLEWMDKIWDSVNNFFQDNTIEVEIDKYYNAESFLDAKKNYEIVYMDIELKEKDKNKKCSDNMGGLEALQNYQAVYSDCLVVIVTVHEEWCQKGYQVNVYRYIYKRNLQEELQEMLQSAMVRFRMNKKISFYVVGKGDLEIAYKDMIYIETYKRNVRIHTTRGNYINNKTLREWEKELEKESFYRIHKSYLINLKWVDQIEAKEVLLYNKEKISLSLKKKEELWTKLLEWRFDRKRG